MNPLPSKLLTLALLPLALAACGAPTAPPPGPEPLATAQSGALSVTLLTTRPLAVGRNQLFYAVTRDGVAVTQATVVQKPLMSMASMKHSCPLVNPPGDANALGQFEGQVMFSMPSSDMEPWDLTVEVTLPGEPSATAVKFEKLAIADSNARQMLDVAGAKYLVTLTLDGAAKVGKNRTFVTAHRPDSMKMNFTPVTDLTLVGSPEMPSMGHGSSGNVNPTHQGGGVYEGTVNFSMAGDWVVHLELVGPGDTQLGKLDWRYDL